MNVYACVYKCDPSGSSRSAMIIIIIVVVVDRMAPGTRTSGGPQRPSDGKNTHSLLAMAVREKLYHNDTLRTSAHNIVITTIGHTVASVDELWN